MFWLWILAFVNAAAWGGLTLETLTRIQRLGRDYLLAGGASLSLFFTLLMPLAMSALAGVLLVRLLFITQTWPSAMVRLGQIALAANLMVFCGYLALVIRAYPLP